MNYRAYAYLHRINLNMIILNQQTIRDEVTMPAPAAILNGIDDKSVRQQPYVQPSLSQHTPLLMLMLKRGSVKPQFIQTDMFGVLYDQTSIEVNSKWHSHQSVLAQIALDTGNANMVIKRIVDENTKTATVCVGTNATGTTVRTVQIDEVEAELQLNDFVPILQFAAADPGAWGNCVGVQIFKAPDKKQNVMGAQLDAVVYEAVVTIEDDRTGKHRVLNNIYGEQSTYFTMKPDSVFNNVNYYFDDIMRKSFIEPEESISRQAYFSDFKLDAIGVSSLAVNPDAYWKEDILTGVASNGHASFRKGVPIFAFGGNDGFSDYSESVIENRLDKMRKYEEACALWLSTIDETNEIVDMAKYPISTLWDSGFTKETKLGFKNLLQYRKDIWLAMATTSVNRYYTEDDTVYFDYQPKLSNQEAVSLSMYYRSVFSGIPESVAYGTPTVRVTLVGQDGVNRNSTYRKRQTVNNDLFEKVCKYCGSGDGRLNPNYAFDQSDLNVLDNWHDLTMDYLSPPVTDQAWDAGLVYVQNKDTRRKFYPTYQTLYPDDTSVLNNIFTMIACCWITKQHFKAWTMVTGDSKSSNLEVAEKLDQFLNTSMMNSFDGRFRTVSTTEYTGTDIANGFSFTTETVIYSNMSKHTASFKIIAHRMSDIL